MQDLSKNVSVAIIGLGARGLSVLERLLCFAKLEKNSHYQITIFLIDPGIPGVGVHSIDQEDYILLNTPIYLPTLFPGDIFGDPDLAGFGLTFQEWYMQIFLKESKTTPFKIYSVQPGVYLPRSLLGKYLNWVFEKITEQLPCNIVLETIAKKANSISKNGKEYSIKLHDGSLICAENLFLTIGHAERNDLDEAGQRILKNPYPLKKKFADNSYQKVALAGMGLVAFDIISELTIGRGGQFIRNQTNDLIYQPSGNEPIIYLFSKSGVPYGARPIRESEFTYAPIRLTRERVQKTREKYGIKLDFQKNIMPLLYDEMAISFYIACVRNKENENAAQSQYYRAKEAIMLENLHLWLDEMGEKFGRFDPHSLLCHDLSEVLTTADSYRKWVEDYLQFDIAEARKGPASPIKCALEAMLQVREGIREAVEFDGLIPSSLVEFFYKISPLINKNSIGPELQRSEELLALIKAGVVDLSLGPNPKILKQTEKKLHITSTVWDQNIEVDLFCEGYLKSLELDKWDSSLVKSMIHEGIIQRNAEKFPGLLGVQIDRNFRAIPREENSESNVWIIGIMCEGTTYYNNYVPLVWQGLPSTPFVEVHTAVNSLFMSLNTKALISNTFSRSYAIKDASQCCQLKL